MWEQFIAESPWMSAPLSDRFDQQMSNLSIDTIASKYTLFDEFDEGDIYISENEVLLVKNHQLVCYYKFQQFHDYIQTKMTWQRKGENGTFRKFFAEYIVPTFKVVESDYSLTPLAFDMWKKLIILYPHYNYYTKDNGKIYKLKDPNDVYTYSDPITKDENSTFIVEYERRN